MFESLDRGFERAAVGLHLRLTGAASGEGAASLALKVGPQTAQPREFDIAPWAKSSTCRYRFTGVGPSREDIEDQLGPVHHLALAQDLFETLLLPRSKFVVEERNVALLGFHPLGKFANLPSPK